VMLDAKVADAPQVKAAQDAMLQAFPDKRR